jgi:RNA polymerase sigma-70 factor (ECF subfamily)
MVTWQREQKNSNTKTVENFTRFQMTSSFNDALNEEALLKKAQDFDLDALSRIHDLYHASVYRYIAFRLSDSTAADDLTNEVFTRFLDALRNKKGPRESVRSWLMGTASNIVNDYYRQLYRSNEIEMGDHIASEAPSLDQIVQQKMTETALYRALENLTAEQQHVLALRFGDGRSIKEVAHLLNKTEGSVKMLQARAIAALGDRLELFGGGSHG